MASKREKSPKRKTIKQPEFNRKLRFPVLVDVVRDWAEMPPMQKTTMQKHLNRFSKNEIDGPKLLDVLQAEMDSQVLYAIICAVYAEMDRIDKQKAAKEKKERDEERCYVCPEFRIIKYVDRNGHAKEKQIPYGMDADVFCMDCNVPCCPEHFRICRECVQSSCTKCAQEINGFWYCKKCSNDTTVEKPSPYRKNPTRIGCLKCDAPRVKGSDGSCIRCDEDMPRGPMKY
jgi:hypothetical protein